MQKRLNIEKAQGALSAKGLTQTALAKQLDVSKEAVSQWLKNKSYPRPNKLLKLGKLLGLSYNELVLTDEPNAPIIAFRKVKGSKTKDSHIEKAQEVGRFLRHLVPHLPFSMLEVPPVLKSPSLDYEYLQQVAQKVRSDINVGPDAIIDFTHLIKRFGELQAVIVPVLWGVKKNHANAMHILLPEFESTWVYLNLDVNVHDFKFWMAHELGHCLSPSLTGTEGGEDFADAFAGALLFPEEKARAAYSILKAESTITARINYLLTLAEAELISPYTIILQVKAYAEYLGKSDVSWGKQYYRHITEFNKRFENLSEILFDDIEDVSPKDFIEKTSTAFETPFFSVLSKYLKESKKGPGFVQSVTNMPLLDSRSMYAELT